MARNLQEAIKLAQVKRAMKKALLSKSPSPDAVTFSSFWQSLGALVESFLRLVVLEAKQAANGLAFMLAFALAGAVLVITGWLALIASIIALLVQHEVIGLPAGFFIAALLSIGGASALFMLIIRRGKSLMFEATRRQLAGAQPREREYEKTS